MFVIFVVIIMALLCLQLVSAAPKMQETAANAGLHINFTLSIKLKVVK